VNFTIDLPEDVARAVVAFAGKAAASPEEILASMCQGFLKMNLEAGPPESVEEAIVWAATAFDPSVAAVVVVSILKGGGHRLQLEAGTEPLDAIAREVSVASLELLDGWPPAPPH